jgi:ankyrin repeat protein
VFEKVKVLLAAMDPTLINTYNKECCTPLHLAVSEVHSPETVSLLIKHGADVHARCSLGQTPLFKMHSSDAAVMSMLLEAGADVHARDYLCNTVLHSAATLDISAGVICCLLKAGADPAAVNTVFHTAADVAQAYKHSATAALLRRAECDSHSIHQKCFTPMLPMHLLINPDHTGWRCSTDMKYRTAVFDRLSELLLFDSQPDRIELLQCVEFELYSSATDLAEYHDMNTVQHRAIAV